MVVMVMSMLMKVMLVPKSHMAWKPLSQKLIDNY